MNCPKCNAENEATSKFCKNCGWDLTITVTAETNNNHLYLGIVALMFPLKSFLFKIHHKLFLIIYGKDEYYEMYENIFYKLTLTFLELIWFTIPVLIVLKSKSIVLKIIVIVLCFILFAMQCLSIFDIYNWNNFWYQP